MLNFLDLCKQRRSVRAFEENKPSEEACNYVMECVRMAPSAVNFQPWRLRYLTEADDLQKLGECYNREWFKSIPSCFIVYKDSSTEWVRKSDSKPHGDIDVAIAVEHLCLSAAEQGLGTCWVCNFDVQKCLELFPVPNNLVPVVLVPMGYPADKETDKKRKALEEILF